MPERSRSREPAPQVRVQLPVSYSEDVRVVSFTHRSDEWENVDSRYVEDSEVRIPDRFAGSASRVEDEARHVIGEHGVLLKETSPIRPGGVALVLESPHDKEFDRDLRAIRPLNNASSERLLMRGLPQLLREAEALSGIGFAGRQLVLVNSIQHQCSLHHFMRPGVGKLQRCVRDAVWTAMFGAGGADDLIKRLHEIAPALVVLAPTRIVAETLVDWFGAAPRPWPWLLARGHPTSWVGERRLPKPLPLAPDGSLIVTPTGAEPFGPRRWIPERQRPYRCDPMELVVPPPSPA